MFGVWSTLCFCFVFTVLLKQTYGASKDPRHGEVCIQFIDSFLKSRDSSDFLDASKLKTSFIDACKTASGKDERLCTFLGATEISPASSLNILVGHMKNHLPADKVCEKLCALDSEICDIRYDFKETDLKKLRVKELKKILDGWQLRCDGCTEKIDFINLIKENLMKFEPEAAAYLKARNEL